MDKGQENQFDGPAFNRLGLSPINSYNGPSYVEALFDTGQIAEKKVSWQLATGEKGKHNITFGGDIKSAYHGSLVRNFILEESEFFWNVNF
jgi:hypothetical protein